MTPIETPTVAEIRAELQDLADPVRATHSLRFFKTGPGQYGEGDKFLGLTVPEMRTLARKYRALDDKAALELVASPWHEERALPALRALLELPFEHAIVSHGEPVHTRAAYQRALEIAPWRG